MSIYETTTETNKKWSLISLVMGFLCIGLLVMFWLVNMKRATVNSSQERGLFDNIGVGIFVVAAIISIVGFVLGVTSLVKAIKKPEVYGSKGVSIIALILNSLLAISLVPILFTVLPSLLLNSSNKNLPESSIANSTKSPKANTSLAADKPSEGTFPGKIGRFQIDGKVSPPQYKEPVHIKYFRAIYRSPDNKDEMIFYTLYVFSSNEEAKKGFQILKRDYKESSKQAEPKQETDLRFIAVFPSGSTTTFLVLGDNVAEIQGNKPAFVAEFENNFPYEVFNVAKPPTQVPVVPPSKPKG